MKPKTQLLFLFVFFVTCSVFSQNASTYLNTEPKISKSVDLQTFIENTYLNAVNQFNQENYPAVDKGKFKVMVITANNEYMLKESSYFKGLSVNQIKEFIYVHHVETTQSLGLFTDHYGMITIKLK